MKRSPGLALLSDRASLRLRGGRLLRPSDRSQDDYLELEGVRHAGVGRPKALLLDREGLLAIAQRLRILTARVEHDGKPNECGCHSRMIDAEILVLDRQGPAEEVVRLAERSPRGASFSEPAETLRDVGVPWAQPLLADGEGALQHGFCLLRPARPQDVEPEAGQGTRDGRMLHTVLALEAGESAPV